MNPLVRGLFERFIESEELQSVSESDAFELFAASLGLPDGLIAQAPLTDFSLDPGAPGVDVAVMEVNGQLVRDEEDLDGVASASGRLEVALQFMQIKRSPSIDSPQILNSGDIVKKFLNGDRFPSYPNLDQLSSTLSLLYSKYASKLFGSPTVELRFISTAPASSVADPQVEDRRRTVEREIALLGHVGQTVVEVWGSDDIHGAWQRKHNANRVDITLSKQLNLPEMPGVDQAILGIASLSELFKMLVDADGNLDERVFYDNVRGFQGTGNRVNDRIMQTVSGEQSDLLPVLNNGVTVVAQKYSPLPGDAISLTGYQIVNGCQTSHCLYLASKSFEDDRSSRTFVPLRVVVTEDDDVKSQIILATNSQTQVDENQLVALTNFQKKLESYYQLDQNNVGLYYERRPGQYHDLSIPKTRIVTIQDQLRCLAATVLKTPHIAARYPNRLFEEVKGEAFVDGHQLSPYVASALAAYRLENAFRTGLEPAYKAARYHVLMVYAFQALGRPFSDLNSKAAESDAKKLIARLNQADQPSLFRQAGELIVRAAGGSVPSRDRLKGPRFTGEIIAELTKN
ncbi:AIPR family protein [Janibacter anophelis]|uniref:AIPR family protein n=1 Tax=Janibacter anophelis TaxID=319054 RepID=UPI0009FEC8AA|nr:AIPR family protein [Janibacter anophelis]